MSEGEMPLQVRSGDVARILADLEASDNCVAAALLHNALERGMLTAQQLREAMCPEVCDIVYNVAKMSDICKVSTTFNLPPAAAGTQMSKQYLRESPRSAPFALLSSRSLDKAGCYQHKTIVSKVTHPFDSMPHFW
jgi:hypothetical protein